MHGAIGWAVAQRTVKELSPLWWHGREAIFPALALVLDALPFWVWVVTGIVSGVFTGLVVGAISDLGLVPPLRL